MKQTILVVDDEQDVRDIVSYNLKNEEYEVFTAENGSIGLQKALEIKPDLILAWMS